jgi:hypothetical protein
MNRTDRCPECGGGGLVAARGCTCNANAHTLHTGCLHRVSRRRERDQGSAMPSGSYRVSVYVGIDPITRCRCPDSYVHKTY